MKLQYLTDYDNGYADGVKAEREKQKVAVPEEIKITCEHDDRIELVEIIDAKRVDGALHIAIRIDATAYAQPCGEDAAILRRLQNTLQLNYEIGAENAAIYAETLDRFLAARIDEDAANEAMGEREVSKCKTPGAVYSVAVGHLAHGRMILVVHVDFPEGISMDEAQCVKVENDCHDALEKILSPLWSAK